MDRVSQKLSKSTLKALNPNAAAESTRQGGNRPTPAKKDGKSKRAFIISAEKDSRDNASSVVTM
jgi:hypothetical protein